MKLSIFPYIGNKRKEIKYFNEYLNMKNIDNFIDAFCGTCSVPVYIYHNKKKCNFIMNDIDKTLIEIYKDIQLNGFDKYVKFYNDFLKELTKENRIEKMIYLRQNKENKLYYFVHLKMSTSLKYKRLPKTELKEDDYKYVIEFIRDKRTKFYNLDYSEIFKMKFKKSYYFIDPPYFFSFNSNYSNFGNVTKENNKYKDNTKMYIDILNLFKKRKNILMIISKNEIISYLYKKYIVKEYDKRYELTKVKAVHMIVYK